MKITLLLKKLNLALAAAPALLGAGVVFSSSVQAVEQVVGGSGAVYRAGDADNDLHLGNVTYTANPAISAGYYVGVGVTGDPYSPTGQLTLGTIDGTLHVTNNGGPEAGTIGVVILQSTVGTLDVDLTASGDGEVRGLGLSNLPYFESSSGSFENRPTVIENFLGDISVEAFVADYAPTALPDGSAIALEGYSYAIHAEAGSQITNLGSTLDGIAVEDRQTISVTTKAGKWHNANATAIQLDGSSSITNIKNVNISATGSNKVSVPAQDSDGAAKVVGLSVVDGSTIGSISDTTISAMGDLESTGIYVNGAGSSITSVNAMINVNSANGEAIGVNLTQGRIGSLAGSTINVVADADGSHPASAAATGVYMGAGAIMGVGIFDNTTVDVFTGGANSAASALQFVSGAIPESYGTGAYFAKDVDVTVSGKNGQLAFVTGPLSLEAVTGSLLGKISGNFEMYSYNEDTASPVATGTSVGYVIGSAPSDTVVSIGFKNTTTTSAGSAIAGVTGTSAGYEIDWENTSLTVHRDLGLSGGAAVFGRHDALKTTVLGAGSVVKTSVKDGMSVAAWLNGVDVSSGELLGTVRADAQLGVAVGLSTTATDLLPFWIIRQSALNSKIKGMSGTVEAVLASDAVATYNNNTINSMVVGYLGATVITNDRAGFAVGTHFKTEMLGSFSGDITAQLNDISSADGALRDGTLVAGIVNYGTITQEEADALWGTGDNATKGSDLLSFDGNAYVPEGFESPGNNDVAGTSVTALIYDSTGEGTKEAVAFGQAIMTLVGDTELTTTSTGAANTTRITGDITTGTEGAKSLSFQKGHFTATSTNWNAAAGISFGNLAEDGITALSTATVQLSDIVKVDAGATVADGLGKKVTLNTATLDFAGISETNVSQLIVGNGMTLDFNGLATVNVTLNGTAAEYMEYFENGGGAIFFVDARLAETFDTEQVNYVLTIGGDSAVSTDTFKIYHDGHGIYLFDKTYVPEPSTATLSLLALAGLLARRRRKQTV